MSGLYTDSQGRYARGAIGIADDFAATQFRDRSQIGPSFFRHMDAGNICTPLLVDGCISLLSQNVAPALPYACFTFRPNSSYACRLFEGTQTRAW